MNGKHIDQTSGQHDQKDNRGSAGQEREGDDRYDRADKTKPSHTTPEADPPASLERIEKGLERLQEMMADLQNSMYQLLRQSASKHEAEKERSAGKRRQTK